MYEPSEEVNEIFPAAAVGLAQLTSKLIISGATPGEDEYSCVAEAAEDDEEDLLALQKVFLPTKPIITYNYDELFQELGSVAVLPCRVHSLATAQVMWQDKNERPIHAHSRMRILPSGDLLISSLRWSDMGNFTCIAKNLYGKDSVNTFVYPTKHSLRWSDMGNFTCIAKNLYGKDSVNTFVYPTKHSLRWSDMGNFTCIAKNLYGKDSVNTFFYPIKQ
ncbi:Insulin-related peptide binding protein [Operophtera brumata]|uniref:Insulin-related peptide binding protein n=1 Tax=Operophtera brumata TaxID=104452 RepID=A0A0L7LUV5_OPEBR|nr:Insulin-related peptide binding protein [Operophtera brumata]